MSLEQAEAVFILADEDTTDNIREDAQTIQRAKSVLPPSLSLVFGVLNLSLTA